MGWLQHGIEMLMDLRITKLLFTMICTASGSAQASRYRILSSLNAGINVQTFLLSRCMYFPLVAGIFLISIMSDAVGNERVTEAVKAPSGSRVSVYSLEAMIRIAYDAGIILAGDQAQEHSSSAVFLGHDVECRITATLVHCSSQDPAGARLVTLRLQDPGIVFSVNGEQQSDYSRLLVDDLQRPCVMLVDDSGRIAGIRYDENCAELSRGIWRAIASVFQFCVTSGSTGQPVVHVVREDDQDGQFMVSYEAVDDDSCSIVAKHPGVGTAYFKTKHERIVPLTRKIRALPVLEMKLIPSGGLRYCIGMGNEIIAVHGEEYKAMHASEQRYGCMTYAYTIRKLPAASATIAKFAAVHDSAIRRMDHIPWRPLRETRETRQQERETLLALVQQSSTQDILKRLQDEEIARLEGTRRDTDSIRQLLVALITFRPEDIPLLSRMMLDAPSESAVFTSIAGALADAGTPAAQTALVNAIRSTSTDSPPYRVLMNAIRRIEAPDSTTARSLVAFREALTDERDRFAVDLLLGSIARRLSYISMPLAEEIMLPYVELLRETTKPIEVLRGLAVLGNSGVRSILPVADRLLLHPDREVRLKAVSTLRFVEDYRADSILAYVLASDSDTLMQEEVLSVIAFRGPCHVITQAQVSVYAVVLKENLRLAILNNLASLYRYDDTVRALIETASESDRSLAVREMARTIVVQHSDSGRAKEFDCGPIQSFKDR